MLMMFAEDIAKIPLEKVCPLNADDLLLILNRNVALGLCNIQNESDNYFSIKSIMEKTAVFSCKDFEARCKEFSEIMDTRLERFYQTKKAKYIFFDEEEQNAISEIFSKNKLNCVITIYLRSKEDEGFQPVDFEEITMAQYDRVKQYIRKYKIKYVIRPDRYMELKIKRNQKAEDFKTKYEKKKKERDLAQIREYFEKYPQIKNAQSEDEIKKIYRELAKKYHPDLNGGDDSKFKEVAEDFTAIQETAWFKNLDNNEGSQPEKEEQNKDKAAKKKKADKNKRDGIIHKTLKYIVFGE